ncbi:MAG: 3-deoxy-manno-octulosonate cytidylyltransferase [Deltaproteobacteria bacterium]|nr:MAG: 3-deoxy-manno-octulosonate cytidylyltransferase [Deltaproteobacteria bacterium]
MKAIGIIPARLGATRFPNKPMATLLGMPMVGHCYHRTRLAPGIEKSYVATCDQEIFDYIQSIGGKALMTSTAHTRATTRTAEAIEIVEKETGSQADIIVMVQGDEPLIPPETISETLSHFNDSSVEVVNIMSRLRTYEQFIDKNNVKVVVNKNNDALYFSREPIPSPWKGVENVPMYMQTGIIAFRRDVLLKFNKMAETRLEQIESVDMNRILENGGRIRMVLTEVVTIGVDTPQELKEAEKLLESDITLSKYLKP